MKESLFHFLKQISPLQPETVHALEGLFHLQHFPAHSYLIKEGQFAKQIGFLESGVCRAYFLNQQGKEYNKQFFVGPTLVGAYSSLLTQQANKIAQQFLTDSKVWLANYESIVRLYPEHQDLERLGRRIAEYYFLEKEKKELEMALMDADQRYLIFREEFPGLEMQIPQYHIASYLGISATQLSRVRRKMSNN